MSDTESTWSSPARCRERCHPVGCSKRLVRPLTRRVSPTCNPATSPAEGLSMLASSRRPRRATTTSTLPKNGLGSLRSTAGPSTLPGRRSSSGLSARIDRPTVHNAAATATPAATRRRQAHSNTRAATISRTIAADRDAAPRVRRANGPNAAPPSAAVATASGARASASRSPTDERPADPGSTSAGSGVTRSPDRSTPPAWRHRCPAPRAGPPPGRSCPPGCGTRRWLRRSPVRRRATRRAPPRRRC